MAEVNIDDVVNYVKTRDVNEFRSKIKPFLAKNNVISFIAKLQDNEIKMAADWCKKENIFLIHKIFEQIDNVDSVKFLKSFPFYDKLDSEKRTWLHVAVIHDRSYLILEYLIREKSISIECKDDYDYTPLHYYCQKEKYDARVLNLLLKDQFHLTMHSKDDLTPLEFACSNQDNLNTLRQARSVDMKKLLKTIDNVSHGIMDVKPVQLTKVFTIDRIWLNLLQKNDKYMLKSYIKNDEKFSEKYYLEEADILSIIRKCPENGQGILSFVKERYLKSLQSLESIFFQLTGINPVVAKKRPFYRSALFLALITGRFQLVLPLVRCCQFDIVPYAILVCLVCKKLAGITHFPDQVVKDVIELKETCESYAIAVMNSTYTKDLSPRKVVISTYINSKADKLHGKSILQVAYFSKCARFLCLPCCQEALTQTWRRRGTNCPQITFWLHSAAHVLFLTLFSYVLVTGIFARISILETLCYIYGLGYLAEEVRQVIQLVHTSKAKYYIKDAANIIDLCALGFMTLGFLLRIILRSPESTAIGDYKLFQESRHVYQFGARLCLCLSLIAFYMRVLYFASINSELGPKLKMINIMIGRDLLPLIFIFIVFLLSFGITFQSLLFPSGLYARAASSGSPNVTFMDKTLLAIAGDIFRKATFTIFDFKYTLSDIEENSQQLLTDSRAQVAVYMLLLVFIVVVNVMLMNLLIALFSNTVTIISQESKQRWKSERFGFIHEYSNRTILPPPLNMPMLAVELIIRRRRAAMRKKKTTNMDSLQVKVEENTEMKPLHSPTIEIADDPSISYYIYQAFAMSGQRYRLLKDVKDLEYEKEIHFKNIESKLESMDEKLRVSETKLVAMAVRFRTGLSDLEKIIKDKIVLSEDGVKS